MIYDDDFELLVSDESPTARDADGKLIAKREATLDELRQTVTVWIDEVEITDVPKAVLAKDERGNIRYQDGQPIPRATTFYDAALLLVERGIWTKDELNRRIPVLCHQEHLDPVAVCRMCSINIETGRRSQKLNPACQHKIEDGWKAHTRCEIDPGTGQKTQAAQAIEKNLRMLASFLMADHYHPEKKERAKLFTNELERVGQLVEVKEEDYLKLRKIHPNGDRNGANDPRIGRNKGLHPSSRRIELKQVGGDWYQTEEDGTRIGKIQKPRYPYSSRSIQVDHENCILCDRCVRSCTDIKKFKIIGHAGKGYQTRISFDLDEIMNDSNCVQCGECMTACPTGALTMNQRVRPRTFEKELGLVPVDPTQDIQDDPAVAAQFGASPGRLHEDHVTADEFLLLHDLIEILGKEKLGECMKRIEQIVALPDLDRRWGAPAEKKREVMKIPDDIPLFLKARLEMVLARMPVERFRAFYKHFGGTTPDQLNRINSLFQEVPYPYMRWNEGSVRYRDVKVGDILCFEKDNGNTAFILLSGRYEVWISKGEARQQLGFFQKLFGSGGTDSNRRSSYNEDQMTKELNSFKLPFEQGPKDLILGEMACITNKPRTATIRVGVDGALLEVSRNMLDMIQRNPRARETLDDLYKGRALFEAFRRASLFTGLKPEEQNEVRNFILNMSKEMDSLKKLLQPLIEDKILSQQKLTIIRLLVQALGEGDIPYRDFRNMLTNDATITAEEKTYIIQLLYALLDRKQLTRAEKKEAQRLVQYVTPEKEAIRSVLPFLREDRMDPKQKLFLRDVLDNKRKNKQFSKQQDEAAGKLIPVLGKTEGLTDEDRKALREGCDQFGRSLRAERQIVYDFLINLADKRQIKIRRYKRGEVIVSEGVRAVAEGTQTGSFYIIRYGFVNVSQTVGDHQRTVLHLGENQNFGEIALLYDHPTVQAAREATEGRRTATITALDEVEVLQVPGEVFRDMCFQHFKHVGDKFAQTSAMILQGGKRTTAIEDQRAGEFIEQGLYQGQKLLVLDLLSCTRCDECTRACADSHDGHARLLREGRRFGDFLVATSCRSCYKPYCMDGCPVDAIHRDKQSLEIKIDQHCIGCGLCERQCPYASIQMVEVKSDGKQQFNPDGSLKMTAAVTKRAVNCNLCEDQVPKGKDTFCVAACPHNAAFRWSGEELLEHVKIRDQKAKSFS